jgi:O-antigen ligase
MFGFCRTPSRDVLHWLVVAIVASLPWSTSATSILVGLWVAVSLACVDWKAFRQVLLTPAVALPVLLACFAIVATMWSPGGPADRWNGLVSFLRLLIFPLVVLQYRESGHGKDILITFLASCTLLLLTSFVLSGWPSLPQKYPGVPVKDYIVQSIEFAICGMVLVELAIVKSQLNRGQAALLSILAAGFFVNILFVASGRTTFCILAGLVILHGWRRAGLKGAAMAMLASSVVVTGAWVVSPYFRGRILDVPMEVTEWRQHDAVTSSGLRLLFWKKALRMMAVAPIVGHGTGSIESLYAEAAKGGTRADAEPSNNPHNQTLTVGLQLGSIGLLLLWAMWLCHIRLFLAPGTLNWVGTVLVVQNVIGSIFNSTLFDFTEAWTYIIGVGVAVGMVAVKRDQRSSQDVDQRSSQDVEASDRTL